MDEIRLIPGHERYGVTADGRVWSRMRGEWRELGSHDDTHGYLKVKLSGGKQYKVHVLIAQVFIGPRPDGLTVDHVDGVKTNNSAANLEYITHTEQNRRARRLGLVPPPKPALFKSTKGRQWKLLRGIAFGEQVKASKLTDEDVRAIRTQRDHGASLRLLAASFGVSSTQIHRIVLRKKWAHIA